MGFGDKFKERTVVLSAAVADPGTVGLLTLGTQTLVMLHAVFAAVNVAVAVWAKPVPLLDVQRKRRTTIMALPHRVSSFSSVTTLRSEHFYYDRRSRVREEGWLWAGCQSLQYSASLRDRPNQYVGMHSVEEHYVLAIGR